MVYLKSVLTGLGAAAIAACVGGLWVQGLQYRVAMTAASGDNRYVDVHWHKGPVFLGLLLIFAMGFAWQYRKGR